MIDNIRTIGKMISQFFRDWFLPVHTQALPEQVEPPEPATDEPELVIKAPEGERYSR